MAADLRVLESGQTVEVREEAALEDGFTYFPNSQGHFER